MANLAASDSRIAQPPRGYQILLLVYQCQRCKGEPVAFLVSRHEMRLRLEGRSPFEYVEVPNYIPKQEEHLYRDAIIASQTGKVLAAIFYLRAFIEQFGRRIAKIDGRTTGEQIMEAYNDTLPEKNRDHMPSLKEWYERLSAPIHSANEDPALFEEARAEIDRHFDFRRIFKIS